MTGIRQIIRKFTALTLLVLLGMPTVFPSGPVQFSSSSSTSCKKVAADLDKEVMRAQNGGAAGQQTRLLLVQPKATAPHNAVQSKLASLGGKVRQTYKSFSLLSVELPLGKVRELEADYNVEYIAPDRAIRPSGLLEETTGTKQIRNLLDTTTLDGNGIELRIKLL